MALIDEIKEFETTNHQKVDGMDQRLEGFKNRAEELRTEQEDLEREFNQYRNFYTSSY